MVVDHHDSFLRGMILRSGSQIHVLLHSIVVAQRRGRHWEQTCNHRTTGGDTLDLERTSYDPGPVVHQMESNSFVAGRDVADSAAVVLDSEGSLILVGGQTDDNVTRLPVLDRIIH